MELLIFWIIMAVVTAMVARSRGRSGLGFFLYGMLIWPIALTQALLTPRRDVQSKPSSVSGGNARPARSTSPQDAFVPHGMVGGRPFRDNPDGSVTVLFEGREVSFPGQAAASEVIGAEFKPIKVGAPHEPEHDGEEVPPPGRRYPSYVAGLAYDVRLRSGAISRSKYAFANVRPGDHLMAVRQPNHPEDPGAVALVHMQFPLGYVPRRHAWVGQALDEGDEVEVKVVSVERSEDDPSVAYIPLNVTILKDGPGA